MSLDPAVEALIEEGQFVPFDLVRFELPGHPVGYHRGARPLTFNGFRYRPNRFLDFDEDRAALGVAVTQRTLRFSGIPSDNPDELVARIEEFDYLNAPVIFAHLAADPETGEIAGLLMTSLYEIREVSHEFSAMTAAGVRTLTINIVLEPPGRSARGATLARRSHAEQRFDNDPDDTCLEYASVSARVPRRWGQR